MDKIQVNRITNANVYLEDNSLLGRAEELNLPEVEHEMVEHRGLGMFGAVEFWAGLGKMEATIKWSSLYPEVMGVAVNPFRSVRLQARASLETYTQQGRETEVPVVVHLTGTFKKFPAGKFKHMEAAEYETTLSVTALRLVVDGEDIVEINVMSNIYKVKGQDVLAGFKRNIGG